MSKLKRIAGSRPLHSPYDTLSDSDYQGTVTGDEFLGHGRTAHREALYDETLLVPLIIRYPGRVVVGVAIEEQV